MAWANLRVVKEGQNRDLATDASIRAGLFGTLRCSSGPLGLAYPVRDVDVLAALGPHEPHGVEAVMAFRAEPDGPS